MTIRLYANRKSWPLERVQVAVRHSRASLQASDVFEADVTLEGALDDAQRARLMEIGERCPVHPHPGARLGGAQRPAAARGYPQAARQPGAYEVHGRGLRRLDQSQLEQLARILAQRIADFSCSVRPSRFSAFRSCASEYCG